MNSKLQVFAEKLAELQQRPPLAAEGIKNYNGQALFAALLNNELRAQVGEEAHRQADYVIAEYFKAVLLCRENKLVTALAQLHHSDALLPTLPAGTEDFVLLFKLSAWGNYYYKAQEGARAIELLREGLFVSADLERRGYGAFIYRRIEQLQNIANIHFKQQHNEAAHELLKNVLTFMHSGTAVGLLMNDWDATTLTQVRIMQEGALHSVVKQISHQNTLYLEHPVYDSAYYYRFFFKDTLRDLKTDIYNRVVLHNWLYVKASYFEQGPAAFFDNVLEFLADEAISPAYNIIKANLLSQAIWSIRQQAPLEVHQPLIEAIRGFSRHHITDPEGRAIRLAA